MKSKTNDIGANRKKFSVGNCQMQYGKWLQRMLSNYKVHWK
jgi:hypothetical protein